MIEMGLGAFLLSKDFANLRHRTLHLKSCFRKPSSNLIVSQTVHIVCTQAKMVTQTFTLNHHRICFSGFDNQVEEMFLFFYWMVWIPVKGPFWLIMKTMPYPTIAVLSLKARGKQVYISISDYLVRLVDKGHTFNAEIAIVSKPSFLVRVLMGWWKIVNPAHYNATQSLCPRHSYQPSL